MKKFIIFLIILVVILGALFVLTGLYADRILDPYVRSLLEQNKPMNHRIEYKKIKVNLFKGFIKIRDVKMSPVPEFNKDENIWMEISVSTIRLTDFDIRKMLFEKALDIGDFDILQPDVVVHLPLNPPEEIIDSVQADRTEKVKKQALKSISLERMLMSGGSFKLMRDSVLLASSPAISFVTEKIRVIKDSVNAPVGYTYEKMILHLSDISLYSQSGLYDMRVGGFTASKGDSTITLEGFRMIPKYDKKEFSGHLKFQDDRFDLTIGKIELARIGIEQLIAGGPLRISALKLDKLDADIYRDKNVTFNMNKYPLFHNEMFMKLSLPLYLDTLAITNSRISYGELVAGRPEPGIIVLEDFNLYSYNLTNQVEADSAENVMKLTVNAKVMGEGPLNAELDLPLEGNRRAIHCRGSVGAMALSPLNSMLEPSINMKFNGGKLNRMTFDFSGNDNQSAGWMEFLYQDLDVVLLKKDSDEGKGFLSYMANTMTLSNNPAPGKDLKIVSIGFERDKNKGMINYIWKTIQSGMVHTILPIKKYQINRKSSENQSRKEITKEKKKKVISE